MKCVVLEFSFLCLLLATHLDEQDDGSGEDYDENDGYEYTLRRSFRRPILMVNSASDGKMSLRVESKYY